MIEVIQLYIKLKKNLCELEDHLTDLKQGEFDLKPDKKGNLILVISSRDKSDILVPYDKSMEKY